MDLIQIEIDIDYQKCSFLITKEEWHVINKHIEYHKKINEDDLNMPFGYTESIFGDITVNENPDIPTFRAHEEYHKYTDSITTKNPEYEGYLKRKHYFNISSAIRYVLPNVIQDNDEETCNPQSLMSIFDAIFEHDVVKLDNLMKDYNDIYDWSKSAFHGIIGYAIIMNNKFDSDVVQTLLKHNVILDHCNPNSTLLRHSLICNDIKLFEYVFTRHPELLQREKYTLFSLIESPDVTTDLIKKVMKMATDEDLKITQNGCDTLLFASIPNPHFETVLDTYIKMGVNFNRSCGIVGISMLSQLLINMLERGNLKNLITIFKYFPNMNLLITSKHTSHCFKKDADAEMINYVRSNHPNVWSTLSPYLYKWSKDDTGCNRVVSWTS